MKKLIIIVSLFSAIPLFAQTEVVQGVTRGKEYGVVYTLPKTEINIEVKVDKITYTPGEFSRYADRYLRLSNVSGDPEEYWELKSVIATSTGIPDSENTYFVKLKDKTVAPLIELTEEGLLKSINVPFGNNNTPAKKESTPPAKKKLNPRDFLTEEIIMANSTAKMAELTSKEIYNIRESRNALLRGQADNMPKDGEQLKLMLDNLDAQESAMLELFSGTRNKEERTFTIKLTPNREMKDEVIFRFSKKLGVVANNDLAGAPIYFSLANLNSVLIPQEDENAKKKKINEGVAYNVPGKAQVTISNGKEQLFREDLPVTQFGVVEYLAPALFNKNSTIKVTFNPSTGGIIKIDRE